MNLVFYISFVTMNQYNYQFQGFFHIFKTSPEFYAKNFMTNVVIQSQL